MKENEMYTKIKNHIGHDIKCVKYGGDQNVTIECHDCNEVLYSEDRLELSSED